MTLDGNSAAEEDELFEFDQSIVRRWFREGRYGRVGTIGDGSCFFHAVCKALDLKDYADGDSTTKKKIAHKFRAGLSKRFTQTDYDTILETVVSSKPKSYEDIKRMLTEPATWAEEIMIKWSSKVLGCNIVFLNLGDNVNNMYCGVHDKKSADALKRCEDPDVPTIVIAWIDHSHFELVVRIDEISEKEVKVRKAFDPKYSEDLQTIRNVMMAYTTKCKI
jgi:hypothetical protein